MEVDNWKSQIVISNKEKMGLRKPPYAFTEQGVAMLSSVLKSKKAIRVNVAIMRVFVNIRKFVSSYKDLADKIRKMEIKYDGKISEIYKILNQFNKNEKKKNETGFKYN